MIDDVMRSSDYDLSALAPAEAQALDALRSGDRRSLARVITAVENRTYAMRARQALLQAAAGIKTPVLGITGTGGAGKSSLTDELILRLRLDQADSIRVAVISIDPSRKRTGGALLGDRIRMNAIESDKIFMRSLATRDTGTEISAALPEVLACCKISGFDLIVVETSGIGQGESAIVPLVDTSLYVMTPEFGAASQLEKIDMLDFADFVAINKFDRKGSDDALRDVRKQYQRNHEWFAQSPDSMPVFGTMASRFNDDGVTALYQALVPRLMEQGLKLGPAKLPRVPVKSSSRGRAIVPPERVRYLAEISGCVRDFHRFIGRQARAARERQSLRVSKDLFAAAGRSVAGFDELIAAKHAELDPACIRLLERWPQTREQYAQPEYVVKIRDKEIRTQLTSESLSGTKIRKVSLPRFEDDGEVLRFLLGENLPGSYPYTAAYSPSSAKGRTRRACLPARGDAFRTNQRFKRLSEGMPAHRLSTAFDSVTLYGWDPDTRPRHLRQGGEFRRVHRHPRRHAGAVFGFRPVRAGDIGVHDHQWAGADDTGHVHEHGHRSASRQVPDAERARSHGRRIPEDQGMDPVDGARHRAGRHLEGRQGQNTCIFSTEFALKMMGDMQEYFVRHQVQNFYSVSISGYHIAEAGANPISQLAFTLANGFTYVESYLARGMHIDDFAGNLSFFFSNGMDPEYSVIGRVARRIWAVAMRNKYGANERSQKLKYHVQTSGRSLHAQEMAFNDIRTTLQALCAIYDNCNSLHTNAYDEAVTTPTEESVRRAMAIQLIINREWINREWAWPGTRIPIRAASSSRS